MKVLPECSTSHLIRTDFSDDAAWRSLRAVIEDRTVEYPAFVTLVDDRQLDGATIEELMAAAVAGQGHFFIADRLSMEGLEQTVLAVDLVDKPGRSFRLILPQVGIVDANWSVSNMDFFEVADNVDADGVFRGFREP
jgi:hypothetical protein